MSINLVTFTDHQMTRSAQLCLSSALKHGVDNGIIWHKYMITDNASAYKEFYEFNKDILDAERGAGFWLWKPYIIYKELLRLNDGDILIYSDAGQEFVGSVKPVIDAMDGPVMLFSNGWKHVEWCKADCMFNILNWDMKIDFESKYASAQRQHVMLLQQYKQSQASLQIYRVSPESKAFVKEWLLYCQMPGLIDDYPSKLPNYPTFAEHRHDQAILTCVALKHGIPLRWFPTLTNMHQQQPGDNYPAIINHHRKRDHEW